jgi:eukaryotic-like serine/threonine-protein kinase
MSATRWQRIDALFHEACDLPPADRAAFLAAACGDDAALQQDVQALLDADVTESGRITEALVGATLELAVQGDQSGLVAGPYRIVR